jgi:hypothetical protein
MSNLPNWPGASTVYGRLAKINTALCHDAWTAARKRKRPYSVPDEVESNIRAMSNGDEEACKAAVLANLSLALGE